MNNEEKISDAETIIAGAVIIISIIGFFIFIALSIPQNPTINF